MTFIERINFSFKRAASVKSAQINFASEEKPTPKTGKQQISRLIFPALAGVAKIPALCYPPKHENTLNVTNWARRTLGNPAYFVLQYSFVEHVFNKLSTQPFNRCGAKYSSRQENSFRPESDSRPGKNHRRQRPHSRERERRKSPRSSAPTHRRHRPGEYWLHCNSHWQRLGSDCRTLHPDFSSQWSNILPGRCGGLGKLSGIHGPNCFEVPRSCVPELHICVRYRTHSC